jgi:N-acetylglucosamine kinase-like BadF-type ATPase
VTRIAIGVDCGGTKARAVAVDETGQELGRAEGPGGVATAAEPWEAASAVASACRDAAASAGLKLPVDVVWAGITGAGREAARSAVESELSGTGVGHAVHVGTDVHAAFHDAFGTGPGVLLIAGTGSIAYGRAEDGREGRVGGWGHHIGDEGSAYAMGREALRRAARAVDGRGSTTALVDDILLELGAASMDDVVTWRTSASKGEVAALAPLVTAAAAAGDTIAREIQGTAVEDLERHVLAILEQLGPWSKAPTVALTGGLLRPGRALRDPLIRTLSRQFLTVLGRDLDPAVGAAKLGLGIGSGGPHP